MPSKLKPPTRSSDDYSMTAVGAIFVTRPVSITLPKPIGTISFAPPIDAAGRMIPVPIYKAVIPICPEEYEPGVSQAYLEHELVRTFWYDTLIPELKLPYHRQTDILQRSLLKIRQDNRHRDVLLPYGMECRIRFESLLTTSDLLPEIREDEAAVQELWPPSSAQLNERSLPVPIRSSRDYSSTVVGTIVVMKPVTLDLRPTGGMLRWHPARNQDRSYKELAIYKDVIPLLPEEYFGVEATKETYDILVGHFWEWQLNKLIGRRIRPEKPFAILKQKVRALTNTYEREPLPEGMKVYLGFLSMLSPSEMLPELSADEAQVRKAMSDRWQPSK